LFCLGHPLQSTRQHTAQLLGFFFVRVQRLVRSSRTRTDRRIPVTYRIELPDHHGCPCSLWRCRSARL
jgi:hypothetical protein